MSGRWGTHRHAAPPAVRRAVLERDGGQCTATDDNGDRCTTPATDVHHLTEHADGGTDDPNNLASLCAWHHRRITAAHAHATRWRTNRKRQISKHPGLR